MSLKRRVNYRTIVDEDTFLGQYMKTLEGQETARAYDFWTGVWLLCASLGRDVSIPRPRAPVFLNWYIILAGDSGITRKSSAVNHARKLLPRCVAGSTLLVDGKTTPEQLLKLMHEYSEKFGKTNVAICVSELINLMGKERYAMALPGLLTDLYDCREHLDLGGTIERGSVHLKHTFVTLLSASTPRWLMRAINPDVIEGGFTSRTIFVPEEKPKQLVDWPAEEEVDPYELLQPYLGELRSLAAKEPVLVVSEGGRKVFSDWYRHRQRGTSEYLLSFESREDSHVLRLAGVLAVNDRSWTIDAGKIKRAIRIISELKALGSLLFSGDTTEARVASAVERIRNQLIAEGPKGILQSKLYHKARPYLTKDMFDTVMDIMHELRFVDKFEERNRVGRPSTIWRATKNLSARGSIDAVLGEINV